MVGNKRKSFLCAMPKAGGSAVLVAILATAMALGSAGCALPLLGIIPTAISLAHAAYKAGSTSDDADAKNPDAEEPTEEEDLIAHQMASTPIAAATNRVTILIAP